MDSMTDAGIARMFSSVVGAAVAADQDDDSPNPDLHYGLFELNKSHRPYVVANEYYGGTRGEFFASIRVRRAMDRTGTAFKVNFAKTPVDAVVDRLEISSITADSDDATKALQDMWEDNQLDEEAPNLHRRACEYGDAYVIVWPTDPADDGDDEDDSTNNPIGKGGEAYEGDNTADVVDTDGDGFLNVDIFYNSPVGCRLIYDEEQPLKKRFAIKKWPMGDRVRVDLYYRDRIERYVTQVKKQGMKAKDYVPYDEDGQGSVLDNPFGEIPIFHFRTDRPYGTPEHYEFYGAQDALRKLIVSHMSGVDYQSFPQRYGLMDPDTDTGDAVNSDADLFEFPLDTGATSRPSDPQSQLTADPGSLWLLKGYRAVGQFAEADPKTFLEPMITYLKFGAAVTNTPLRLFDYTAQLPSGASQIQLEGPFIKKVAHRLLSFGATWRQVFEFALKLAGFPGTRVQVRWKPPVTADDMAAWETLGVKIQNGLPIKQAFLEAGYTIEQVDEWFPDDEDDLPHAVELLVQISTALANLGTAMSLGVVDQPRVDALISAIVGELGETDADEADEGAKAIEAKSGGGSEGAAA